MPGFLNWIQDPENEEEVLALYFLCKFTHKSPSYYAFKGKCSVQSEYEIDFLVMSIGARYESEKLEEMRNSVDDM